MTAWRAKHKLMQVMAKREAGRALQGEVVIDDAYLGGARRGKAGRGSENKVAFVAGVQLSARPSASSSVRAEVVPRI